MGFLSNKIWVRIFLSHPVNLIPWARLLAFLLVLERHQRTSYCCLLQVPAEFIVQRNTNANPPTLFLAIESIIEDFGEDTISHRDRDFLKKIYPRLKVG